MKNRTVRILIMAVCMAFLFCVNSYANIFKNVGFTADCSQFTITGEIWANWGYHTDPTQTIQYALTLTKGNEIINVSGDIVVAIYLDYYAGIPFTFTGVFENVPCGDVLVEGILEWYKNGILQDSEIFTPIVLACPCENLCTRTPGYWKNHPEAWPVDSLMIGDTTYSKEELLEMLNKSVKGDIDVILIKHLIAAKLNVLSGSSDGSIELTIAAADAYLAGTNTVDDPEDLKDTLDDFNNSGEEYCDNDNHDNDNHDNGGHDNNGHGGGHGGGKK